MEQTTVVERPAVRQPEFLSRHGWKLLTIAPLLWVIFAVMRYGVDVPFLDQWELVPFLDKSYQGQLTLGDLWVQHNEHRIFFPRMLMLGMAHLTGWNTRWELVVNLVLGCGIFAVLAWQIQRTRKELGQEQLKWAVPACSLVVFSLCQYENWLWGWQMQMFMEMLALTGAIVVLAQPRFGWGRFVGAAMLGIVATFSFANGVWIWPLGAGILLAVEAKRSERFIALGAWLLIGFFCLCGYFHGYQKPVEHPPLATFFEKPLVSVAYVLKYIGSVCAQYGDGGALPDDIWGVIFGLAGPATLFWAAWTVIAKRIAGYRMLLPYLAVGAYSLASAVLTAVGRAGLGGSRQALASRYTTMTAPFWVGVIVLLLLIVGRDSSTAALKALLRTRSRIARWLLFGVVAFIGLSSALSIRRAEEVSAGRKTGRRILLDTAHNPQAGGNHDGLYTLFPTPRTVVERYPVLMRYHLSVFREQNRKEQQGK